MYKKKGDEEMENKIRIKLGPIEVEYEGSEKFLKEELPDLIRTVSDLYKASNLNLGGPPGKDSEVGDEPTEACSLSTTDISAKLSCDSGPDLVLAAAARLTLGQGMSTFSRQTLIKEMRSATAYYKPSYNANLTSYLNRLVRAVKLNTPSPGLYALTAGAREELRSKLA
jgi:hypothetical protein